MGKHKERPKEKGSVTGFVESARSEVESLRDEIANWKSNIEEKFSQTQKYSDLEECESALDSAVSSLESAESTLGDLPEDIQNREGEFTPSAKKKQSRADRLGEATGRLEIAKQILEDVLNDLEARSQKPDEIPGDASEGERDEAETGAEEADDVIPQVQQAIDEIDTALGECENVCFPGMFG